MGISAIVILAADAFLEVAAQPILEIFGHSYALQATPCLRILVLAALPLIIKNHYLSVCRIHDRIVQALVIMIPGGLMELGAAGLGAHYAGLSGICLGWVVSVYIETLFMGTTVYQALYPKKDALQELAVEQKYILTEPLWNINTLTLPAIKIVTAAMSAQRLEAAAGLHTATRNTSPIKAMPVGQHTTARELSPVTTMPAQIWPNTPSIWPDIENYTQGRYQLKPTRLQSYSYNPSKEEIVTSGSKNTSND
jgi:hypothetical protein